MKNFRMFRELCGEGTLKNVVVVTTMWEGIDHQTGEKREAELKKKDTFFKSVLTGGGQMARHENTVVSAQEILRLILHNHPLPLRIQEELVDENKDITETGAGGEMGRELNAEVRRLREEMDTLKEQMKQAIQNKDEVTRKELEGETKGAGDNVERLENDLGRMGPDYRREQRELEDHLKQMEAMRTENRLWLVRTVAGIMAPAIGVAVRFVAREAVRIVVAPTVAPAPAAVPAVEGFTRAAVTTFSAASRLVTRALGYN